MSDSLGSRHVLFLKLWQMGHNEQIPQVGKTEAGGGQRKYRIKDLNYYLNVKLVKLFSFFLPSRTTRNFIINVPQLFV